MSASASHIREITPRAGDWRHFAWDRGSFDAGRRSLTSHVEGTIQIPDHLLLLTVSGGADWLEVETDCGHRYVGADRAGAVSFMPGARARRFKLRNVRAGWATISLSPSLFTADEDGDAKDEDLEAFTNIADEFLASLIGNFVHLHDRDGNLDVTYCDAMGFAAAQYLLRRSGASAQMRPLRANLPRWKLRRLVDYIEANLSEPIRIADLAALSGTSEGHFHRAFRGSTGLTPLRFISERRVRRAEVIMQTESGLSIAELALRVGFLSPSHFARVYRSVTGKIPSRLLDRR